MCLHPCNYIHKFLLMHILTVKGSYSAFPRILLLKFCLSLNADLFFLFARLGAKKKMLCHSFKITFEKAQSLLLIKKRFIFFLSSH